MSYIYELEKVEVQTLALQHNTDENEKKSKIDIHRERIHTKKAIQRKKKKQPSVVFWL